MEQARESTLENTLAAAPTRDLIHKTVVFFLGETPVRDVTISHEHVGFEFLLYDAAVSRATFRSLPGARRAYSRMS